MAAHKTTMADIAKRSGVSQSTVSLVLNQKEGSTIPPDTVARVLSAARELHYVKAPRSQGQQKKRKDLVMVLVSDLTNPYYSFIVHELEMATGAKNLRLLCCSTFHRAELETAYLETALTGNFCAAIFLYPPDDPQNVNQVNKVLPVIAICDKNAAREIDLVELNNFQAGRIAAEHLLKLGHRKIAILSSNPQKSLARSNRMEGICEEMAQWGVSQELGIFTMDRDEIQEIPGSNVNYKIGYALSKQPKIREGGYTAFIALNDMIAMGAIDGFSTWGAHFPEDYSLVGFDNLLYTGLSRISLTTVDHHTDLLAQVAVDLLLRRIQSSADSPLLASARYKVQCQPQLVVRNSTSALLDTKG